MPTEVTVDAPVRPMEPVDPNVKLPRAAARAAAVAEAFYKQAEQPKAPEPPAPPAPPAPEVTATVTPEAPPPEPPKAPEPPPPPPEPPKAPEATDDQWKHRYHAMEGRYKQSVTTIQTMQEQMREMGQELVRMQEFMQNSGRVAMTPQGKTVPKLITDQDRETYGDELLDTVQRAAVEAVAPKLSQIEQENQRLKADLVKQRQQEVYRALDAQVPNWRAINNSPRFKSWLTLTDLLSGQVRGNLLNTAFKAADAPRLVAFFNSFVNDEVATGSAEFAPRAAAQPQVPPAPRQPALALEALASPGRATPAAADTGKPVDKPVFTRSQIRQFYDDCRKGVYVGREAERQARETALFEAQNEGRIRN